MDSTAALKAFLRLCLTRNTYMTRTLALGYLEVIQKSVTDGEMFPDPQSVYEELNRVMG